MAFQIRQNSADLTQAPYPWRIGNPFCHNKPTHKYTQISKQIAKLPSKLNAGLRFTKYFQQLQQSSSRLLLRVAHTHILHGSKMRRRHGRCGWCPARSEAATSPQLAQRPPQRTGCCHCCCCRRPHIIAPTATDAKFQQHPFIEGFLLSTFAPWWVLTLIGSVIKNHGL